MGALSPAGALMSFPFLTWLPRHDRFHFVFKRFFKLGPIQMRALLLLIALCGMLLASATFAQLPKARYELGGGQEAAARAACEQAMIKLEAEGKMDGFSRDVRPSARAAIIKTCIAQDRFRPPPTPTAYTRGLAALDGGDFDAAIAEFTAAIVDDPKDTFSYIRRGAAYEKKGDAASAIGDYRKVLKLVDAETGAEYAAKIRKLEKTKK